MEPEQQFSLSWNNFHGNVSRELSALLGSGALADVTLAAGGHLLHAHRLVLAICSPYFKRMFQSNPGHHPIVVLRDVTHEAMRDLLQFMYHGEVSVRREDLTGFIATAELLQIKGLTNKETEEDEPEQELPKQRTPEASTASQQPLPETPDPTSHDNLTHTVEMKRKLLNERIQRLNQLKRKSEEFVQSSFSYQTEPPEKIPKPLSNHNARYEGKHYPDVASYLAPEVHQNSANREFVGAGQTDVSPDLSVKTECDDSDIIVTDPAVRDSMKSYESVSDQLSQDDATGLILMDLKSIVSGKFPAPYASEGVFGEHYLTTIPQRDGKKKYPQRSCRCCWRNGKRRDTRFMCGGCAVPFCKAPCFEAHLLKVAGKGENDGCVST